MPCMCWISEEYVSKELNEMRNHLKEAARLARYIHGKGDLPVHIQKTCHQLFDDYFNGTCQETGKDLDCGRG